MVHPEVKSETEVVVVATAAAHLIEEAIVAGPPTEEAIAAGPPTEEAIVVGLPIVVAEAIVAVLIADPLHVVGAVGTEGMLPSFSKKANLRPSIPTPARRRSSSRASAAHGPGPTGPHAQGMVPRESR